MRGTKAKALRRFATLRTQHAIKYDVTRNHPKQIISGPVRYLYQALKGKNTIKLHTPLV